MFKNKTKIIILTAMCLVVPVMVFAARTQSAWYTSDDGSYILPANPLNVLIQGVNKYINFGTFSGSSGYGLRDSGGTIQFKNSGGSWAGIGSGSGSSGSGTVSTSTIPTISNLAYWTSNGYPSLLGSVATTSVTCTGSNSCTSFTAIGSSPISLIGTGLTALTGNTLAKGYFLVGDDSGNSQATSTIFINSKGYVGIGTTTPWAKLAVNPVAGDGNSFVIGSSTATKFIVTNSGNVGIGTTSPASLLHTYVATGLNNIYVNSGAVRAELQAYDGAGGIVTMGSYSNHPLQLVTGTAPRVYIDTNGNVGIGTTGPQAKLHVGSGTITGPSSLAAISGSSAGNDVNVLSLANVATPTVGNGASINFNLGSGYGVTGKIGSVLTAIGGISDLTFSTYNGTTGERMRITSQGNVGIATTSPSSKLDINGSVKFEGTSYATTASLGGGALLAGACASTVTTITTLGNYASTTAVVTTPQNDPGDGFEWNSVVMSATTVKTRVCAEVAGTPAASVYNLKIIN